MIRPRSLRVNSLSSLIASGGVFAITLALSAVLARSINAADYQTYATATAFLPLVLLLAQSLRSCAGSAIIVALQRAKPSDVAHAYRKIVMIITTLTFAIGAATIEVVRNFVIEDKSDLGLLTLGLYCILFNITGISLSLIVTGPAAANEDFLPDNLLKILPPALMLAGFIAVLVVNPNEPLKWLFVSLAISPWPLTAWLLLRNRKEATAWFRSRGGSDRITAPMLDLKATMRLLTISLASVSWWNMTAYFATTVTIAIVALTLPHEVVAFTMAFSLIGVVSGGLVAVSAPLASRVALIAPGDFSVRVAAFRRFNGYCILYILVVALVILVVPARVYEVWVGTHYGAEVRAVLLLLLPATVLRLQTMCFALFVMSVGRQSTMWLSPMAEAVVATFASYLLAPVLGLAGVAGALALSASVRLFLTLLHDVRLNKDIFPIGWKDFLFPLRTLR
jgi:O-antigen/teichoic acid export membrane protein